MTSTPEALVVWTPMREHQIPAVSRQALRDARGDSAPPPDARDQRHSRHPGIVAGRRLAHDRQRDSPG